MALYADLGAQVTLVTCTRGEEGEVLVPALAHLASGVEDGLGKHREVELANAMQALGITDFRFLGAPEKKYIEIHWVLIQIKAVLLSDIDQFY
jgi:N-acetyl-1-D-myo-inositol-2-amino-2-deoxy-alpha-D-glucopyranoside deacetylase